MRIEFKHLSCQVLVIKGLAYLFIYLSENDSKLKDWINFGIHWKNLLSHSRPWPWPWVCDLGLACLGPWPWLACLGLDTSGLVNIPACHPSRRRMDSSDLDPIVPLTHMNDESAPKTAYQWVQPFFAQLTRIPNTHTQTDTQTTLRAATMHCVHAMRPKIVHIPRKPELTGSALVFFISGDK